MPFDFTQDNEAILNLFGNCDVAATLSGVQTATFRGIIDLRVETVSPYESSISLAKSELTIFSKDAAGITSAHTIQVKRDTESTPVDYKFDGKPQPDGAGFTLIHLGLKI